MAVLGTYTMHPADEWDFDIDYSKWLPDSDGLSEAQKPDVTADPDDDDDDLDIVSVTPDYERKRVKIWVRGGRAGKRYQVTTVMRSREGRVRQDQFFIAVR